MCLNSTINGEQSPDQVWVEHSQSHCPSTTMLSLSEPLFVFFLLTCFNLKRVQHNVPQERFIWAGTSTSRAACMLAISSIQRAELEPDMFIPSAKSDLITSAGL